MTPEEKRAMIAQILAGGMADASGSPLRQRKAMEDAQMKQRHLADTFMAARAAPLESLLMQGDMTPGQMYANAAGNDAPGSGPAAWARERALAGNTVARQPFNALESQSSDRRVEGLSPYLQDVFNGLDPEEQAGLMAAMAAETGHDPMWTFEGYLGGLPATKPKRRTQQPSPAPGAADSQGGFMSILDSLNPEQRYMLMGDEGIPDKNMYNQLLGGADPSQVFGLNAPPAYVDAFNNMEPGLRAAILAEINAGASVDDAFDVVLGIDMNAISRGQ